MHRRSSLTALFAATFLLVLHAPIAYSTLNGNHVILSWNDLVNFEIVPVVPSKETSEVVLRSIAAGN